MWYSGDDSAVVDFCQGNTKKEEIDVYYRTAPSLFIAMKTDINKQPIEIFADLKLAALAWLERHITDATKDIQQVMNALKIARENKKLSSDAPYN